METIDGPNTPTNSQPIWNTVLRYGGYSAAVSVLLSLLFYLSGINMFTLSGTIISFVFILGVSFTIAAMAMRYQRDKLDGGIISYGKALAIGVLVVMIGSFASGIWNYVLVNFIDPDYIATLKEQFVHTWGDTIPADRMEEALARFDDAAGFTQALKSAVMSGAIFGLIVGLITAAFIKREPRMDYMR